MDTEDSHRTYLKFLALAILVYSLPMLLEIRLSPQLHTWVYGVFPHDSFSQMIRQGGFRPVVFLKHGLRVAMFAAISIIAVVYIWRSRERVLPIPASIAFGYLMVVLVLCKSLAALIFTVFGAIVARFTTTKMILRVSVVFALIAFTFPFLRGNGYIPTFYMVELAEEIDEDRAASLQYRFDNEDRLLEKARERPLFGWGSWARNRVYDLNSGKDITTTDGHWIIVFSVIGWVGYVGEFGLLCLPILLLGWRLKKLKVKPPLATSVVCLILAINLMDLLPNSSLMPLTWLAAGGILGFAERQGREGGKSLKRQQL